MSKLIITAASRAVLPTPTTILTIQVARYSKLSLEISHEDAGQTLDIYIWRRLNGSGRFSRVDFPHLLSITDTDPRSVDLDVSGTHEVELRGVASGGGLTCLTSGLLVD